MIQTAAHTAPASQERRIEESAIRVRGLTKKFPVRRSWGSALRHPLGGTHKSALNDLSFDVGRGEFFGLLGPNGAGKTTLFKILSTLILPDAGTARVEGHDLLADGPRVRRVLTSVVSDDRSLYWRLSARENLRLYAGLNRLDRSVSDARIEELLETVDLSGAGEKLVGAFSSGMKQRLLIARALLSRPDVLLLDEPTRSLDPITARSFRAFLREQIGTVQGCTVMLATHNAEEALELCDRLAVLDRGRLVAIGTAAELTRAVGDDRHRAWLKEDAAWSIESLSQTPSVTDARVVNRNEEGWVCVDMQISGGPERVAGVLADWTAAGIPVLQFERVGLTLADLLERLVLRRHVAATAEANRA